MGGGVLTLLVLSFTAKAHQSKLLSNHLSLLPLPVQATVSFTNDDITDKLAADEKFIELIDLGCSTAVQMNSLSAADKIQFKKYAVEKDFANLSKLYTKAGIDYNRLALKEKVVVEYLNNKYNLNTRGDILAVLNTAVGKLNKEKLGVKPPPTFLDCMAGFAALGLLCDQLTGSQYQECWALNFSIWVTCIIAMD